MKVLVENERKFIEYKEELLRIKCALELNKIEMLSKYPDLMIFFKEEK